MSPTVQAHTQRAAAVWSSGGAAYDRISRGIADAIEHAVVRPDPQPGGRIQFGDMTNPFGGTGEWLSVSHNAVAAPEPGAMAMLLAGLTVVGGDARRHPVVA